MSYVPLTWVAGTSKLGPTNLNHLETGLQSAAAVADSASVLAAAALPTPAGSNGQFLKRVGGVWVPTTFLASDIPSYPTDVSKALLGDGSWAQVADAQVATSAAIKGSKLATGLTGPPGAEIAYQSFTSAVTLATTSEGTATTVVTAPAFTGDAATAVWLEFCCPFVLLNSATSWNLEFFDGSTGLGGMTGVSLATTLNFGLKLKVTPSAASKTYSVRGWVTGTANSSVGAGAGGAATNLPGFIRIVKA